MFAAQNCVKAFFEQPELYLDADFPIRVRSMIVRELVGNVIQDAAILDLGCGNGALSLQFIDDAQHVSLVDLSANMLETARANIPAEYAERVTCINSDFLHWSDTAEFDVVLCLGVLAYVSSLDAAIEKISTFLKPGAYCILQITDSDQMLGKLIHTSSQIRNLLKPSRAIKLNRLGASDLLAVAAQHHLNVHRHIRYSWLLPGMGIFPNHWLFRYELLSLRYPKLGRFGSTSIFLMQKENNK